MVRKMPVPKICGYVCQRARGLSVAIVAAALDAASKAWALAAQQHGELPLWLVPGQLGFHFAWNRGMSFSLLEQAVWGPVLLGVVAVVACGWFFHWLGEKQSWAHQAGLGLLIGGALGNVADRIMHGAVVDFLLLNPWGLFPYTFNVADMAITFGVALLLLDSYARRP